jgi:hypothetical protein
LAKIFKIQIHLANLNKKMEKLKRNKYLTLELIPNGGFGSLFQLIIATYSLARYVGINYIHTPFRELASIDSFNKKNDKEVNDFIVNCLLNSEHTFSEKDVVGDYIDVPIDVEGIKKAAELSSDENKIIRLTGEKCLVNNFLDQNFKFVQDTFKTLRENFKKSKYLPQNYFNKNEINIAIHVRNFCIPPDDPVCLTPNRELFSPDNHMDHFYRSFIKKISEQFKNHDVCFHIYAIDSKETAYTKFNHFANYLNSEKHRMAFHINENHTTTFLHLAMSDIFLMAKSSFSYIAHFYCDGLILIRNNFWHPLLPNVISIGDEGAVNESILNEWIVRRKNAVIS